MTASSVRTFNDPVDYGGSIQGAATEMVALGRGQFSARLTRIKLHRLWLQRFSDNLPRIARAKLASGRTYLSFSTRANSMQAWGGREVAWGSVYQFGRREEVLQRSSGHAEWATMSLPVEDYLAVASTVAGREARVPDDGRVLRPSAGAFARLQDIHATAGRLAEESPEVLENAESARSLEQELIQAMVDCTIPDPAEGNSSSRHEHRNIMRRFHALIEANGPIPLYVPEICAALGVSNSTLLRCCREQIGVSPQRYLWLRRMNVARHELMKSDPEHKSVTEIATNCGFWELDRFAVAYRNQFGERPSETLHRTPDAI